MSISNSFAYSQSTPIPTSTSPISNSYDNDGDEKLDFYQKMLVKNSLVGLYCFAIDKFVFGESAVESLKFGIYSGLSADISDRVANYIPKLFTLNQASSFEKLLLNVNFLSVAGGSALAVGLYNKPYGKMSQPKQIVSVIFSELLADWMMKKYIHL